MTSWVNKLDAMTHGAAGFDYAKGVHQGGLGGHSLQDRLRFAGLQLPQYQRGTLWFFCDFVPEGNDSGRYKAVPSVVLFVKGYPSGQEIIFKA